MIDKLAEQVTGGDVVTWLIIAFLVVYFVYKEWPDFKKRISHSAVKDQRSAQAERTIDQRLDGIEGKLKTIEEKLNRDYYRINDIELRQQKHQRLVEESLEEREIIMRALLGALGGLQELGANGPTKQAETEIRDYLNRKAHK